MKKGLLLLLALLTLTGAAQAENQETAIVLGETITVSGAAITEETDAPVHLTLEAQTHEDVPEELLTLENRVVVITAAGSYRISGTAEDTQILVRAGTEDAVRLILDNVSITCRTAPAIAVESALDPRTAGEYGVTIELAAGSENLITGSHTKAPDDDETAFEYDGAIGSQVSLGFEGSGSLTVEADNEGVEVAFGHLTINGGTYHINASDDPLNVAEDGVAVLTVNDGYVFSAVKPIEGGEGDGIDSNGYIVFNGGTVINLAHPASGDSGIDSDLGSTINGGLIVGAGNMYDPIEADSQQLFMMLEFGEQTDQLVVVTDENDQPVFAYDFPYDYMYIAFSTPALTEGTYRVYLGGEIEGEETDGLYTAITAYVPGTRMQHGEGTAQQRMQMPEMPEMGDPGEAGGERPQGGPGARPEAPEGGFDPDSETAPEGDAARPQGGGRRGGRGPGAEGGEGMTPPEGDTAKRPDMPQMPEDGNMPDMPEDMTPPEGTDMQPPEGGMGRGGMGGGMRGGPRSLDSSADVATSDFVLSKGSTGFTNVVAVQEETAQ